MACLRARARLCPVREQLVHATVQAHVAAEVLQQAHQPLVVAVAAVVLEDGGDAPLRAALREEVQDEQVALLQVLDEFLARILLPALNDPRGSRVHQLHLLHDGLARGVKVNAHGVAALVERVHRVVVGTAKQLRQFVIVQGGNLVETLVGGLQEGRTRVAVPASAVGHVQSQLLAGVARHHAAVARQHRLHAPFLHALQDFLLQSLLLGIPRSGQRTAPALEVVHLPPCQEGRTGNELAHLLLCVTQSKQQVAPDALLAHHGQRQVDTVQCHPVNLLLPAFPVPEGHGVRKRAVVEVVAQRHLCLVLLLFLDTRQHGRQHGLRVVPRDVDAAVVLQVPVHAHGHVDPVMAAHDDLRSLLVEFEEFLSVVLQQFQFKLLRCPAVNALQKVADG